MSTLIAQHELTDQSRIQRDDDYMFYKSHMRAGDLLRAQMDRGDSAAVLALAEMKRQRTRLLDAKPDTKKLAFILHSFCHPGEITLLRRVFGPAFFLIAAFQSEAHRRAELRSRFSAEEITDLVRDERVQQIIDIDRGIQPSDEEELIRPTTGCGSMFRGPFTWLTCSSAASRSHVRLTEDMRS